MFYFALQACQAISSIKLSSSKYIKPGRSTPLVKDVGTIPFEDTKRKCPQNLTGTNYNFLGHMPRHISSIASNMAPGKPQGMTNSSPSETFSSAEAEKAFCRQSIGQVPIPNHSHLHVIDGISNKQTTHASTVNGFQKPFSDDIGDDDDDILKVILVSFKKSVKLHG